MDLRISVDEDGGTKDELEVRRVPTSDRHVIETRTGSPYLSTRSRKNRRAVTQIDADNGRNFLDPWTRPDLTRS